MKKLGIYIHIPFCKQKCNYCDFYSIKWNDEAENNYINALLNETKSYKNKLNGEYIVDSIFFGGGTPTIIKSENLHKILNSIKNIAEIDGQCEISMEANPNTLTEENLRAYKDMGINRLSIGIQSLNDEILKKIGRIHNSCQALEAIAKAQNMGFENINADVMFNIPNQTVCDIQDTLLKIIEKGVKHISFYSLKLEEGTPMFVMERNKKITMPDEEVERKMYYAGRSVMEDNNLIQYEISNFAINGYECRHNLRYWNQEEYIGLGPSAHSFLNSTRFSNPSDLKFYCEKSETDSFERVIQEELTDDDLMFEYIMLKLRLMSGIHINEFNKIFKADFNEMYKLQIKYLMKYDLIEYVNDYIRLTKKGMDVSNAVIEEFMI